MSSTAKIAIVDQVREIAERIGASEGIEIWEVYVAGGGPQRVVRIYIDKPAGVTHLDCEAISEKVGAELDASDIIPGGSYHLEVSSPGVERKLRNKRDFERYTGQKAKVVLRTPIEKSKRWEGTVTAVTGDVITLEPSPGKQIQFRHDQVEKANLKFEW